MLYRTVVLALFASAAAFHAPISAVGASSVKMMADDDWRRSYDGKGGVGATAGRGTVGGGSAPAAAAAPSGSMSVTQALQFMQDASLDSTPLADKISFLKSKGVDAKTIEDAVCVSPLDRFGPVQGHPGEELAGGMSVTQALAFMQDLALETTPIEEKITFLKSKGVENNIIEGAVCVSPLDRFGPVQGHP